MFGGVLCVWGRVVGLGGCVLARWVGSGGDCGKGEGGGMAVLGEVVTDGDVQGIRAAEYDDVRR